MKRQSEIVSSTKEAIKKQKSSSTSLVSARLEQCLNDLSWILEKDSSSCTAVCLINKKLLITDNTYHANSSVTNETLSFQNSIIQYLAEFITFKDKKYITSHKINFLKIIMSKKAASLFKGDAVAPIKSDILEKIIDIYLKNKNKSQGEIKKLLPTHHSLESIAAMMEHWEKLIRRLERVEQYLTDNPKADLYVVLKNWQPGKNDNMKYLRLTEFSAAFLEDRNWLLDDKTAGCAIILTNSNGTHAELKIIDYLLAARLLTRDETRYPTYIIGISKKCCKDCVQIIDIINESIEEYLGNDSIIKVTDTHKLSFEKWEENIPIFLLEPSENGDNYQLGLKFCEDNKSIGYIIAGNGQDSPLYSLEDLKKIENLQVYFYRDYNLIKEIREKFFALPKIQAEKSSHSPMSQSSPEVISSGAGEYSLEHEPDLIEVLKKIPTMILLERLVFRVEENKSLNDTTAQEAIGLLKRVKSLLESDLSSQKSDSFQINQISGFNNFYVNYLFKDVRGVSEQVVGMLDGEEVIFDVYKTLGDGSCGYYSLPIPYDRYGVVELLKDNSNNQHIRKLIANEIFSALVSNHLPKEIMEIRQVNEFRNYFDKAVLEEGDMLSSVIDIIDPNRDKIPDRSIDNVIKYLQDNSSSIDSAANHLNTLLSFKAEYNRKIDEFKLFCQGKTHDETQDEKIFELFIENYIGGEGQLSFSIGGLNFSKETSVLDAIVELIRPPIRLYIWQDEYAQSTVSPKKVKIVYQHGAAEGTPTHVYHRPGLDTHYELMARAGPILNEEKDYSTPSAESLIGQQNFFKSSTKPQHDQLETEKEFEQLKKS